MTNIIKTAALLLTVGAVSAGAVGLARQEPGGRDGGNAPRTADGQGAASPGDAERTGAPGS